MWKCKWESFCYFQVFLETFAQFLSLLSFKVNFFTVILRPGNVSTKVIFAFFYALFYSVSFVCRRKPPECENSDDVVPELGAQDVLQSSQLFLYMLAKRARQSRKKVIIIINCRNGSFYSDGLPKAICCFYHQKDRLNRLRVDNINHRLQSIGVT